MMDNVSAMENENFYGTIYNLVYELDSEANKEYSTDHGDNPIQVISVDPDMPVLDTSSEGTIKSSECNRNNEVPDMFDENALHFPENVSFDPIIDKEVQKILGCSLLSPLNEDKEDEAADSLINSFNQYSMLEKILNSSDVLFNSGMEDCDLGEDLENFDLPRFIMGDSQDNLNELLKENSISSQLTKSERTTAEKKKQDSMSQLVNIVMSTPKKNVSPVKQVIKMDCNKMHKNDLEDIDIETISDGESFSILTANNVEQFGAEEKLKGGKKIQPFKNHNDGHRDMQFSTARSSLSKLPHNVKRSTSLKTSERPHHASLSKTKITPCTSKSYQNTSTESAQLNQRISSSANGDFEDSKSLPETCDLVLFYKQISSCRRRLGLGKGKKIAVCMEHRTDEFKENTETNSIPINPTKKQLNKTNSHLNVNDTTSNNLSDNNCDHSHSKVESVNDTKYLSPIKNKSILELGKMNKTSKTIRVSAKQLPKKSKVTETVIDTACDKNVNKGVVVAIKSDSERLPELEINNCKRLSDSNKNGKTLCENVKVNKNSLTNKDKPVRPCVPIKDDVQPETSPTLILLPGEPKENSAKTEKKEPLKRKLNLEEYKKRREGKPRSCETSSSPVTVLCDKWAFSTPNSPALLTNRDLPPLKPEPTSPISNSKLAVTIKNDILNNGETGTKLLGPIGNAYKKALQMKKSSAYRYNEDKLIQSKISEQENVVILPIVNVNGNLLPMIKKANDPPVEIPVVIPIRRKNSEYIEIVMVSIGVNTNSDLDPNPDIISERLLTEHETLTSERLNDSLMLEHGEDKTIIHLKKDTPKPETNSISVQTDFNMIIKDCVEDYVAEVVASPESVLAASVKERLYGKRKQSSSSNSNLENGNSSKKRCDYGYKTSSRRTNSLNGQRCSPPCDQYSSRSPRRITRINNDRGCHNESSNHNASYNRRSPSISRDRRTHYVNGGSRNSSNSSRSSLSSSSTSSSRYDFVTYLEGEQAHRLAKKNNLDLKLEHRRAFCRDLYADLDDLVEEQQYYRRTVQRLPPPRNGNNFDSLLEEMKRSMEAKRPRYQKGYIPRT